MNPAINHWEIRRWLAIGTGVGIEAGLRDLRVTVVRVRPRGARVLGATRIENFRERPAAEWGAEYAEFLKRLGVQHLAATVLLPRSEVIVRLLSLPGVTGRDLEAALGFQIEALHPYPEEEAAWVWSRLDGSESVLIGIARRERIAQYANLFLEAGVKVYSLSFSAAALYSALRLLGRPPAGGFLALREADGTLEAYGESEARAVFSAEFPASRERAAAMAAAELRLSADSAPSSLEELLPRPKTFPENYDPSEFALAYAAALTAACRRLALPLNLLPVEQRASGSRAVYAPTAVLLALLAAALAGLALIRPLEDRRYLAALRAEIARLEPTARRAAELDRAIEQTRARIRLLDEFRGRSKADLDTLAELTRVLTPPTWLNSLELSRDAVTLSGEAEQAAGLLKVLDESPLLRNSEFVMPIARVANAETFRIRSQREGGSR